MASDNEEHDLSNNENAQEEENEHEHEEQEDQEEQGQEQEQEEQQKNKEEEEEENNEHDQNENQDQEEEEEEKNENANESDDEEFAGFGEEEISTSKTSKKRQILSDESDEENKEAEDEQEESEENHDNQDNEVIIKKKKKHKKDHHHHHHKSHKKSKKRKHKEGEEEETGVDQEENEEEEDEEEVSPEDEEEIANELNEDVESAQKQEDDIHENEASNEDEATSVKKKGESNLERVLRNQKAENKRKNRRKNMDSEEITEMDNTISAIIAEMKNVAAEDRAANEKSLTTVGKLKMMPTVVGLLQKSDFHNTMIELGILGAIAEWLAPLPDRSLPNIKIREALIDALKDFGEIGTDFLKSSGIGKAVMFLYKHTKETKANKLKLEKLIHNWSRPIFNLDANFKQLSREERLQRDIEQVRNQRRNSGDNNQGHSVDEILSGGDKKKKKFKSKDESDKSDSEDSNRVLRPGDPGFIPRARVPLPSHKDYVIRPKSNIDNIDQSKKLKRSETRLDKHKKRFIEVKRNSKFQRAVTLNISDKK